MDTYTIDIEIEHYYGDRMATSSIEACRRLYVRAVSRFSGAELEKYLQVVEAHAAAYASLSHMLRSPSRHIETPLFLSSLIMVIASIITILNGEASVVVAGGMSAGIVGIINCVRRLVSYWRQYSIREAVFKELAENLHREAMQ
jgi:hypothetical protein